MKREINPLRPSLWRTGRILACESRLRLLWTLFDEKELSVGELAQRTGMGNAQASVQLRALNARGLISFRRENLRVLYRAEANQGVDSSVLLLEGMRLCYERQMKFSTVIRQTTAFTHPRRIELVRILKKEPMNSDRLLEISGMSSSALFLHLGKLVARRVVKKTDGKYKVFPPANPFGKVLLQVVLSPPL